jgi:DNA phosphorothioation-associated putative methyltransferase
MLPPPDKLDAVSKLCRTSKIGKILPDALYVHVSALEMLDPHLQAYESHARQIVGDIQQATLVKISMDKPAISYLIYPEFDQDPHPALQASSQVDLHEIRVNHRDYSNRDNPFILHRKETFVAPDYPHHQLFAELTRQEEKLGLLDNPSSIGTKRGWESRLAQHDVSFQGHTLIHRASTSPSHKIKIDRHKAAISRNDFSKPVRLAIEAGLLRSDTAFFDYGCGQGGDLQRMAKLGYISSGWDPHYQANTPLTEADIVNLGYIINVIESQAERREALIKAWTLTRQVLIVAAQVLIAQGNSQIAYGDGIITSRNTFQKYYDQEELKIYIDQVLDVDSIPVALGIYFIFRDESQAQSFRASRFRSRVSVPKIQLQSKRFEDYKEILTPLMNFVTERGRLPTIEELPEAQESLTTEFGNLKRAFQVVLQATNTQEWDAITNRRRQDLLVYLALTHFETRPKIRDLAIVVQNDIKALFGSYQQACTAADLMLMSLGNLDVLAESCKNSSIGKQHSNSLWVHISAIESLDPLLRLYEGCASRTIGRPQEATVVKFHYRKPKISYLVYPDFDIEPHPVLKTTMQIDLRDLHVHYRDYDSDDNPPILHQKNLLLTSDHPCHEKFTKLTQQEEDWGLLDNIKSITNLKGWLQCLRDNCAELKGHRVIWSKNADPYQTKLIRSRIRAKQSNRKAPKE